VPVVAAAVDRGQRPRDSNLRPVDPRPPRRRVTTHIQVLYLIPDTRRLSSNGLSANILEIPTSPSDLQQCTIIVVIVIVIPTCAVSVKYHLLTQMGRRRKKRRRRRRRRRFICHSTIAITQTSIIIYSTSPHISLTDNNCRFSPSNTSCLNTIVFTVASRNS